MGDLSDHFSRWEFRCKGHGQPGHTPHDTPVDGGLLIICETIRSELGQPLRIVSGHRCRWWNRKVKGARLSQHIAGRAADLPSGLVTEAMARRAGARGVGVDRYGWVVHVDHRPWWRRIGEVVRWRYR